MAALSGLFFYEVMEKAGQIELKKAEDMLTARQVSGVGPVPATSWIVMAKIPNLI